MADEPAPSTSSARRLSQVYAADPLFRLSELSKPSHSTPSSPRPGTRRVVTRGVGVDVALEAALMGGGGMGSGSGDGTGVNWQQRCLELQIELHRSRAQATRTRDMLREKVSHLISLGFVVFFML